MHDSLRATWESDLNKISQSNFQFAKPFTGTRSQITADSPSQGYWIEYSNWQERVTIAQRQKQIGGVLLLTQEVSNPLI
ncbi:MAG TPA: hypothetical protein V6D14_06410 [Coleofasciculaceae cyanobacterium]|jgi:hypothetical protein